MEIRLEGKTLAIGILLGAAITIALGVNGEKERPISRLIDTAGTSGTADKADFGLSVNSGGLALVRSQNGDFFSVNPQTGMAVRILHARRLSDEPSRNRESRGKVFNYFVGVPVEEDSGYGK